MNENQKLGTIMKELIRFSLAADPQRCAAAAL